MTLTLSFVIFWALHVVVLRVRRSPDTLTSAAPCLPKNMIAKRCEGRWTKLFSNWNPAITNKQKGCRKKGRPVKRGEDDINAYLQPTGVTRDNNDLAHHAR